MTQIFSLDTPTHETLCYKRMFDDVVKTQEDILAELKEMENTPIDYSDIPPMTEEERATAQFYYKDFLDKLPPETVKELVQQRLAEMKIPETV